MGHLLLLGVVISLWASNIDPSKGLLLVLDRVLLLSAAVVLRRAKLWWKVFLEKQTQQEANLEHEELSVSTVSGRSSLPERVDILLAVLPQCQQPPPAVLLPGGGKLN